MQHCRYDSKVLKALKDSGLLSKNSFTLLDVGVSGGLDNIWRQFEPHLRAVGFDPLVTEVKKLAAEEENENISYVEGWLSCNDDQILAGKEGDGFLSNMSFQHTSVLKAAELMSLDYTKEFFNAGEQVIFSDKHFTLDEFIESSSLDTVDFIKVDTDGSDYFVLRGAENTLISKGVLGIQVECQMHGSLHPHSNIFSNIDLFLRGLGFSLFDLDCWRYTHAALPGQFYYDIPAQTTTGQVQWADALYILDPFANPKLVDEWLAHGNYHKIVSLLMIFDLYGKSDSAAALINYVLECNTVIPGLDLVKLLDLLVPENRWNIKSYKEYIKKFNQDPTKFYPRN